MKTITIRKLRIWISKKRKDDYWTRDDDNGMLDQGKEICLGELEDFFGLLCIKFRKSKGR